MKSVSGDCFRCKASNYTNENIHTILQTASSLVGWSKNSYELDIPKVFRFDSCGYLRNLRARKRYEGGMRAHHSAKSTIGHLHSNTFQ